MSKIGTFDSRAVTLAFWRSEAGMAVVISIQDELRAAREAGDEDRVRELEAKGPGLQIRMMQQVFSTGTVTDILRRVEDLIPSSRESWGSSGRIKVAGHPPEPFRRICRCDDGIGFPILADR